MFGDFQRGLKGQLPLYKIFWIYGLGCPIITSITFVALASIAATLFGLWHAPPSSDSLFWEALAFPVFYLVIYLPFLIWENTSIWRCAFNCKNKRWAYWARASVIFAGLYILLETYQSVAFIIPVLSHDKMFIANQLCESEPTVGKIVDKNCIGGHWRDILRP